MKFKLLHDMSEIQHYKDEVLVFDPRTDKVSNDTYFMCIGHGCSIPMKIGVDVVEVPDIECKCYTTGGDKYANYYTVRLDCPIHKGTLK